MTIETNERTSRKPITHDLILDHTMEILHEHGVAGFRLKDLAHRLEVTIPNLYRYFKDREEIIRASFTRAHVQHCHELAENLGQRAESITTHDDLYGALQQFFPELSTAMAQERRVIQFKALANMHDAKGNADMVESLNRVHEATTRLFSGAQARGLVDPALNAEALSLLLRSMVTGLVVWDLDNKLTVSDEDINAILQRFFQAVTVS